MNIIRSLHLPGISVTAFTATPADLASGIAKWSLRPPAVRRLVGTPVAMVAGAFVGDLILGHAHSLAPVVPLIVIAVVVISVASVALKPRGPGPAGQQGSQVRQGRKNLPD